MALLVAAGLATGAWIYAAKTIDMQEKVRTEYAAATEDYKKKRPAQGVWSPQSSQVFSPGRLRGSFYKVIEDVDERGVPVFYVDYGNGSLTRQWHDPRIQL